LNSDTLTKAFNEWVEVGEYIVSKVLGIEVSLAYKLAATNPRQAGFQTFG